MFFMISVHDKGGSNVVDSLTSPEDEQTVSSASLLLSPQPKERAVAPLCASTPLQCNGVTKLDQNSNEDCIINGNSNGNLVAESTNSIDVLSAGESDAGDTLRSQRHNSSISSNICLRGNSAERSRRRDLLYIVAKELLMTERTYKRDLEFVTVAWSVRVSNLVSLGPDLLEAFGRPCLALEPIVLAQGTFLAKLDKCIANASPKDEEPEYKKIGQMLYDYLSGSFDAYNTYISRAGALVARLESARRGTERAAAAAAAEAEAAAPLPLAALLLRPLHRLLYYRERVTELSQAEDCAGVRQSEKLLEKLCETAIDQLTHAENHAILCQLQRDIIGFDKLLVGEREFLRMGCVYKHSSKGLQQRMLFLFSDILILASKCQGSQFKALSVWALHDLRIEPCDMPNSFTLTGSDWSTSVSACNEADLSGWWRDISAAVDAATDTPVDTTLSPYSEDLGEASVSGGISQSGGGGGGAAGVCWHRAASLTMNTIHVHMRTQLSGYLLRKFKKTHGWQKLWVVVAGAALFFYKSYEDPAPLVSLPLLGYSVRGATEADGVHKELVFRLAFRAHVYYFRADATYTYRRWVETLHSLQC